MTSNKLGSEPFKDFTEDQLSQLFQADDALNKEEARIRDEVQEEDKRRSSERKPFMRLRRSPLEIFNRSLFLLFLGSFLFSFASVYSTNRWWFVLYLISAFSCIWYTPNRKALKELIDAWPNIMDLIKVKINKRNYSA